MKIFMIGGTGLLGSEAAKELISRGHEVTSLALPPLPEGAILPPEMKIEFGNYLEKTDDEMKKYFEDCDGFVFAAGVDERVEGPAPIYDLFRKYNIDPVKRLLGLAKQSGVKHSVILGSYFSYFDKQRPELSLSKYHPYIRSRRDQEHVAIAFADEGFDVAVLELPYIFGTQPGRKPVWVFLAETIRSMKNATLWPKGGTTMVTVHQVAQAVAGAIERNRGGNCYPIGYYNMTWKQLLMICHKHLGYPDKKVKTIPDWMFALAGASIRRKQKKEGLDGGLNMAKFYKLQCSEQYIDKSLGCDLLGVTCDDIDAAIGDSMRLSVEILDKNIKTVDMRGD